MAGLPRHARVMRAIGSVPYQTKALHVQMQWSAGPFAKNARAQTNAAGASRRPCRRPLRRRKTRRGGRAVVCQPHVPRRACRAELCVGVTHTRRRLCARPPRAPHHRQRHGLLEARRSTAAIYRRLKSRITENSRRPRGGASVDPWPTSIPLYRATPAARSPTPTASRSSCAARTSSHAATWVAAGTSAAARRSTASTDAEVRCDEAAI